MPRSGPQASENVAQHTSRSEQDVDGVRDGAAHHSKQKHYHANDRDHDHQQHNHRGGRSKPTEQLLAADPTLRASSHNWSTMQIEVGCLSTPPKPCLLLVLWLAISLLSMLNAQCSMPNAP